MSATVAGISAPAKPSLGRLTRVEIRKMIDTRAGRWLLVLTVLAAIAGTVGQALGSSGTDAQAGQILFTAAIAASVLLPVVGILLVTGEWSQRTGLITFVLVPARARIVAAKVCAALIVGVAIAAICLALALLGGAALGDGVELTASAVGETFLFLAICVSIGVAMGLAFMNTPLAIVLYFVIPFVFGALGAISESLNDVMAWLDQSGLITIVETGVGSEWGKVLVTALIWIALPLAAGLLRLHRADID